MCLLAIAYKQHKKYKVILASNRDEQKSRPSAPASKWTTNPFLIAGQDLEKGGTWLGINALGRFAAITNYRQPTLAEENKLSRGLLMTDYLLGSGSPQTFMDELKPHAAAYNGFNLLFGDLDELLYYSNIQKEVKNLDSGIYGLSNAFLDTPWPKVEYIKTVLSKQVEQEEIDPEDLFSVLKNETIFPDHTLPDTGVGHELEQMLSATFINTSFYGTRSSNVMTITYDGEVNFIERVYSDDGKLPYNESRFNFTIQAE